MSAGAEHQLRIADQAFECGMIGKFKPAANQK